MGFNLDDYEPVEKRLSAYWDQYPHGSVNTSFAYYEDTQKVIVIARITRDDDSLLATGIASGSFGLSGASAQAKAPVEDCETSAIGRALANAGFSVKRPSREEMERVQEHEKPEPVNLLPLVEGWDADAMKNLAAVIVKEMPGRQLRMMHPGEVEQMTKLIERVNAGMTERAVEELAERFSTEQF